jgi:hypothetical protein
MSHETEPARGFFEFLSRPLTVAHRIAIAASTILLGLSFLQPLWRISMQAPQYPRGLYMDLWLYKITGGNEGHDVTEINNLNHYIGMKEIVESDLADLVWMPPALGILVLLCLRVAAIGSVRSLVDVTVLATYVGAFSLGRFVYMLYHFGHNLDPKAPLKLPPFQPVILGTKRIANFTTHSYPQIGGFFLFGFIFVLWGILIWCLWSGRKNALALRSGVGV